MREEMRKEFALFLAEKVAGIGEPVDKHRDGTYGWIDYDAQKHIRGPKYYENRADPFVDAEGCSWVVPTENIEFEEHCQYQYHDSLNGDEKTVIDVESYDCACGQLKDYMLRYEGRLGTVLVEMFGIPSSAN